MVVNIVYVNIVHARAGLSSGRMVGRAMRWNGSSRRAEVLQAAVELLDEVGLDALTTRRLAARLGVQPGALYRHYPSKRALLDAVVEHIVVETAPEAAPEGDWAEQLRQAAGSMRRGMLAHRDGARLMATLSVPGEAAVAAFQRLVDLVRRAGATPDASAVAVDTVISYVNGFTIEEQARGGGGGGKRRDQAFAAGLELILAGIAATLASGSADPMPG
jgi:TetR/AcrR family transcriptional regulator, tetracycline repressor protein